VRIPTARNQDAYNPALVERSNLQGKLNEMRCNSHALVTQWLSSDGIGKPVATNPLVMRLRLDEGVGEELKSSAPMANPASFHTSTMKTEWGETTWLWPDFRMQSSTRVLWDRLATMTQNKPSPPAVGSCSARRHFIPEVLARSSRKWIRRSMTGAGSYQQMTDS